MIYLKYATATGRILEIGECQDALVSSVIAPDGAAVIWDVGANLFNDYVVAGQVTPRPALPGKFDKTSIAVNGEATIAGLPNPTTVAVNGTSHTVTDGEFILNPTSTGKFTVVVSAWPYLDYQETVTCA